MGSDEGGEDDSPENEKPRPFSDLAAELGAGAPANLDADTPPSFADLIDAINQRRNSTSDDQSSASPSIDSRLLGDPESDEWEWVVSDDDRSIEQIETNARNSALLDLVGDAANLLLIGEFQVSGDYKTCTTLLGADTPTNLLLVMFDQSPDQRLDICDGYLGDVGGTIRVVNVGDSVRSGDGSTTVTLGGDITIESIPDPTDMMRIGITISRALSELEDSDLPTAMCFHSLSALLQFVDDRRSVFRFMHTLCGRVRVAGATAHYHLDDQSHDDEVLSLVQPLFDASLRYDEAGNVSINHLG